MSNAQAKMLNQIPMPNTKTMTNDQIPMSNQIQISQ
jgi:hypothetical protein